MGFEVFPLNLLVSWELFGQAAVLRTSRKDCSQPVGFSGIDTFPEKLSAVAPS